MFKFSIAIVLAFAGAAAAQEVTPDPFQKAMENAPPSGMRSGDLRIPEVPRGGAVVPVSGPAGPVVPVAPVSSEGPAGPAPDAPDQSVEINANYDVTMDIYQKILESQGMDTGSIEKRIAANEEIVTRYRPQLAQNEDELRRHQVDFMNRAFQLRAQRDSGTLTEDQFQKAIALEEGKWNRKKSAIAGDATFFREEVDQAEARLAQLRGSKKEMEARIAREGKAKPKKKAPGEALFEGLTGTLEKLSGFQTKLTMDGNNGCKHCNEFHDGEQHEEGAAAGAGEVERPTEQAQK